MVIEVMECTSFTAEPKIVVEATNRTMNERFTRLDDKMPLMLFVPPDARMVSTARPSLKDIHEKMLELESKRIIDMAVQDLKQDWRAKLIVQYHRSRAGSIPQNNSEYKPGNLSRAGSIPQNNSEYRPGNRSRAGSIPQNNSEYKPGNLSRAGSIPQKNSEYRPGNRSRAGSIPQSSSDYESGQSSSSYGGQSNRSRAMSFDGPHLNARLQRRNAWMRKRSIAARARDRGNRSRAMSFDAPHLNARLQRRNAWMRKRSIAARARDRGKYIHRKQYQQRGRLQPHNQPRRPGQRGWQPERQWWHQGVASSSQGWGMQQRWGYAQNDTPPLTPRGGPGLVYLTASQLRRLRNSLRKSWMNS